MVDSIQIGDTVSVSELGMTRRGWLRSLALGGTGIVGLKSAIKRAAGASVEGVPLVLTRDKRGNPDRVRFVSQERYETLERYRNLDIETYFQRYPNLNGITVTTPRDRIQPYDAESGLDLKFYFRYFPIGVSSGAKAVT